MKSLTTKKESFVVELVMENLVAKKLRVLFVGN